MKFTKEQLLEALKAKVSEELVTQRTLSESLGVLYGFVGEEDELEDFVKKSIPILKSFEGQARKQKSDYEKEKLEWEKNRPDKKDGKKDGEGDGDNKSELQKMQEQINELLKREEENKKAKTISEKRDSLKSALKGKDVKNEDWINDQLELIHIDSETDVEALTERLVKSYNKFSSIAPPDITPKGVGGGLDKGDDYSDVVAIVKKQLHRQENN